MTFRDEVVSVDQQRQIEALQQQKQQPQSQPQQEDIHLKLQKYADLHQKGILTDEEFKKTQGGLVIKDLVYKLQLDEQLYLNNNL